MNSADFNPSFATAAETADAVRKKRISASELINLIFRRIDRHNPTLNAIVWQDREAVMARARQADEALAIGNAPGVLHGVPVTIKESFAYLASWISFATLAGVPATVAPVGRTRAALPVGVQVVAPMWEDGTAIEFAALLSELIGKFTAPPAFQD